MRDIRPAQSDKVDTMFAECLHLASTRPSELLELLDRITRDPSWSESETYELQGRVIEALVRRSPSEPILSRLGVQGGL
jgi:hypothetical protein